MECQIQQAIFNCGRRLKKRSSWDTKWKYWPSDCKGAGTFGGKTRIWKLFAEGYGPGGVAILIEALTDNRNRTAADLRAAFSKTAVISVKRLCQLDVWTERGSDDHWSRRRPTVGSFPGRQCRVIWAQRRYWISWGVYGGGNLEISQTLKHKGFAVSEVELHWVPSNTVEWVMQTRRDRCSS